MKMRKHLRPRKPDELVTEPAMLAALVARLREHERVAIDTEAASFHRYIDRVYLIQVSTDEETVLIDPLAFDDLRPLGQFLLDPAVEVLIHDADYDLRILDRDYQFRARSLFDTRIAAQLAGEPAVGLSALLLKYFGVRLNKKLQRADWSQRPLPPEMLVYAADDTRYLPELRDILERQLKDMGRLTWASEEFRRLEEVRWNGPMENDDEAYLRMRGAKRLRTPRARAVLRAVYLWRDRTARALDRAPFRVLGNDALVAIAGETPRDLDALTATCSVPSSAVRRYGNAILQAVEEGMGLPEEELPKIRRRPRLPSDPTYDQRLERLKRLRNRRAGDLRMDPGLVCPNGTLQTLARAVPTSVEELGQIPELRMWQREVIGDPDLLAAIQD
jgi:ribonuclease D